MKIRTWIVSVVALMIAGSSVFFPRGKKETDPLVLAGYVPASSVVYVGIADANEPRPAMIDRMLGPERLRNLDRLITLGMTRAALYATFEDGGFHWRAVAEIRGVIVRRSWTDRPEPIGPSLASRSDFRAAWKGRPSNIRLWIDLEKLEGSWPMVEFRALALDIGRDEAHGLALYKPEAGKSYADLSEEHARAGNLPDAAFTAAGNVDFRRLAARLGIDDPFLVDAIGPAWGCCLRGDNLVVFAQTARPERVRLALRRIARPNYRYQDGWILWATNPAALDGIIPRLEDGGETVVHFTPGAAPTLERLARRYGYRLPGGLANLGDFDMKIRYMSGAADIGIRWAREEKSHPGPTLASRRSK